MCFRSFFSKYLNCLKKSDDFKESEKLELLCDYSPNIIIVGAGAAGLTCAMKLRDFGFENVQILEAENRIGGRIHTEHFADNVVDLGAQWVHGEMDNIVYRMVKRYNVLETTGLTYEKFDCIRSNGQIVDDSMVEVLKKNFVDLMKDSAEAIEAYDGSLGEFLNERFRESLKLEAMRDVDLEVAREFFENFKKMESSGTSAWLEEVSARGFNEYWQCEGDYLLNWKDSGFVTFLHILLGMDEENPLGNIEHIIKFQCHVDHIKWNRPDRKAEVICNKGKQSFLADHVVLTVSLGVLKNHIDSMFAPPLPILQKNAIVGLGFGSVCKIFLEFEKKFWPDNWYGFVNLWIRSDLEELRRSQFEWVENIFGFYCVNYQPRVLLAWVVGPTVWKVEQLSKEKVTEGCVYVLRRFIHKWPIPDPINIAVTKWSINPNFAGTYSFRSMLSEVLNTNASDLSKPVTIAVPESSDRRSSSDESDSESMDLKPILLFAGEATSRHHFSTVHGAVESANREAVRLMNYYHPLPKIQSK